jgi:hypothetical protein
MDKRQACIESYSRLKNLKLVGLELGIPWQTVYVHLRAAGVPVTGDKSRYGSDTDRLAAKAETIFSDLVPLAVNQNDRQFQAKVDFVVGDYSVDVKASRQRNGRWAFSLKKQERLADFFVCFAFNDDDTYRVLTVPGELCRYLQTISLSAATRTKWWDYEMPADQLSAFFAAVRAADDQAA